MFSRITNESRWRHWYEGWSPPALITSAKIRILDIGENDGAIVADGNVSANFDNGTMAKNGAIGEIGAIGTTETIVTHWPFAPFAPFLPSAIVTIVAVVHDHNDHCWHQDPKLSLAPITFIGYSDHHIIHWMALLVPFKWIHRWPMLITIGTAMVIAISANSDEVCAPLDASPLAPMAPMARIPNRIDATLS